MPDTRIEKLDQASPAVRQRLWDMLAPRETEAMFILGNLRADTPGSHLYAAVRDDQWIGVAAYYERFGSFVPFSDDAEVVRQFARHVADVHRRVEMTTGFEAMVRPAVEELNTLGYATWSDPPKVFMEADGLPPVQKHEDLCRLCTPADAEGTVRLLRHLQGGDPAGPVTAEDTARLLASPLRFVIEQQGQIVSTGASSGIAVTAGQIIAVATDPAWRGRGFAGAICARLMRALAEQGATRTVLFTDTDNTPAQRCYSRLGFRITGNYCMAKFRQPR